MNQAQVSMSPSPQSGAGKSNFLPISQLVYSLLSALLFLGLALVLGLFGVYEQFNQGSQISQMLISLAWSLALMGVLLLPSAALSIFRLYGRRLPGWLRSLLKFLDQLSLFSIIAWPLVIGAGVLASRLTSLSWLLLPPFNLLAVGLPILWIFSIGRRSLASGSPLRHWGSFSIGVVLTPFFSFVLEVLLLLGVGVLAAILLSRNPGDAAEINRLVQRMLMSNGDTETITRSLRPLLSRPEVIFGGLAVMSGLIPLIEELLKPLPAWLLGKRLQTPAEGFVAGLLGGAGYALAESLGASGAFDSTQWLSVVVGRAGTDLLHILTSGLMGLALYYAFKQGKYGRLVLTYLMVVVIHGTWNFFSLWAGFYPFIVPATSTITVASRVPGFVSPVGLAVLVLIMLAILLWRNASLRSSSALPIQPVLPGDPVAVVPAFSTPDAGAPGKVSPESGVIPTEINATGEETPVTPEEDLPSENNSQP